VRFTVFYLLCGVAAAFAHVLVTPDHFASEMPMGGASGAISGCIGGFLLLLAGTKIEFKWIVFFSSGFGTANSCCRHGWSFHFGFLRIW
jgi:membrane associated rhomboid family serine protease